MPQKTVDLLRMLTSRRCFGVKLCTKSWSYFPFCKVHNLLCRLACLYYFFSRQIFRICFWLKLSERIKGNWYRYAWLVLIWCLNDSLQSSFGWGYAVLLQQYLKNMKNLISQVKWRSSGNSGVTNTGTANVKSTVISQAFI